jgi:hypothetical protein
MKKTAPSKKIYMDIKTKLETINSQIQSFREENYNGINDNLIEKLEELKTEMVEAFENNKLNKYMVRLPMWLIDMNLMDYKRHVTDKDKEVKATLVRNIKNISNKAIELFEKAFTEDMKSVPAH